jgi:hypothetical protein
LISLSFKRNFVKQIDSASPLISRDAPRSFRYQLYESTISLMYLAKIFHPHCPTFEEVMLDLWRYVNAANPATDLIAFDSNDSA